MDDKNKILNEEMLKPVSLDEAIESLGGLFGEGRPDFYAELKETAWNVLHENPGCEFDEWKQTLIEQYPTEVVDAFGTDPEEVYASISDLWDSWDYEDEDTGECHTMEEWAEYFATDKSVELYDKLAAERCANT